VAWRTETLKRKSEATNHVGFGDWLNPAAARRTWRRVGVPGGFMGWVGDGF